MYKRYLLLIPIFAILAGGVVYARHRTPAAIPVQRTDILQLWNLTNNERVAANEAPLELNPYLSKAAANHCNDFITKNYFDHTNPAGKTPDSWIKEAYGTEYSMWGENITQGYSNAHDIQQAFFNSPEHKANVEQTRFNKLGLATCIRPSTQQTITVELFVQSK